jgi:hypothetical protein
MKKISLLLLILLTGCASRTWTETTDTTRPTGPTREVVEHRPQTGDYFELRTEVEVDGFTHRDTYSPDENGRIEIELLTPALQCLHYDHTVHIELWSLEEGKIVYTRNLDTAAAREVIREYSVQAKLGATIRMREAAANVLDKLIDTTPEQEVRDQLDQIRVKIQLRPSWE